MSAACVIPLGISTGTAFILVGMRVIRKRAGGEESPRSLAPWRSAASITWEAL